MKRMIGSIGVIAFLSIGLFAAPMTPCEELATSVPDDSWSDKQWREHKDAVRQWKAKKGTDIHMQDDPDTSAYRVPGDNASFKELEALKDANKGVDGAKHDPGTSAYRVPDDHTSFKELKALKEANSKVDEVHQ